MTDDNDQAGGFSGVSPDEQMLSELIDRHNDLVQAWEDNEDPDVRSQISFEIRKLDAQINELTEPHNLVAEAPAVDHPVPETAYSTGDWPVDEQQGSQVAVPPSDPSLSPAPPVVPSYEPPTIASADIQHQDDLAGDDVDEFGRETQQLAPQPEYPAPGSPGLAGGDYADQTAVGHDLDGGQSDDHGLDRTAALDQHRVFGQNGASESAAFDRRPGAQPPGGQHKVFDQAKPIGLGGPARPTPPPAPERADAPYGRPRSLGTEANFAHGPGGGIPRGQDATFGNEPPFDGGTSTGDNGRSDQRGSGGRLFSAPSGAVLGVVGVSLVLLAGLLWFGRDGEPNATQADGATTVTADPAAPVAEGQGLAPAVRSVLDGLGLTSVVVDDRDGVIYIGGPVPSQADYDAATSAVQAIAGDTMVDTSGLVIMGPGDPAAEVAAPPPGERTEALQMELDRLLAATPLIFGSGQSALTDLHKRILNNAVLVFDGYPGLEVTVTGYTDPEGDEASNQGLSLSRAENVKAYLVEQGVAPESLNVNAVGEQGSSGSEVLAGLERRVEFEVTGAGAVPNPGQEFRVAIVAPSASNDLAFTQSMVDAVNVLGTELNIQLSVTDNTFVPDEAAAAVRGYAEQGYDLVIAHGSQFGAALIDIAPEFPQTAFAWGTASDTFDLPNVYAYDASAQEGGYVLGALASELSTTKVAGVVGPIEVGDAALYINGFNAGARAENPDTDVLTAYTGSFSDITLATETAQQHIGAGADVLTGSAQMVVGAVSTADQAGALWFGTQANQTSLAPSIVVASQVYHWEVALRPIFDDISAGTLAGTAYTANLANGGLVIEYNPDYPLNPDARQRADQLVEAIINGSVVPPG